MFFWLNILVFFVFFNVFVFLGGVEQFLILNKMLMTISYELSLNSDQQSSGGISYGWPGDGNDLLYFW